MATTRVITAAAITNTTSSLIFKHSPLFLSSSKRLSLRNLTLTLNRTFSKKNKVFTCRSIYRPDQVVSKDEGLPETLDYRVFFLDQSGKKRFSFSGAKLGCHLKAGNGEGIGEFMGSNEDNELEELRGKSTMPDRFKYLTKEASSPPLRWPWFIALAFLLYAWRTVLWELSNWKKAVMGMFQFVEYLSKLVLAIIFHFIGDPITNTVLYIETALNAIRDFYFSIVTSAPVPELTTILILASAVLAIGEAASPNSVNCQPYILTVAGIIGYGAVKGVIIEPFFWLLLFGFITFSRVFKKRDYVSSSLPVATVLACVGEPWIRILVILIFTALAIHHHSKKPADEKDGKVTASRVKIPFPLLGVALAIGIRVAAKWAGYRHLTWMIV